MDLAEEGKLLFGVRTLKALLYAELGLLKPVKLMLDVRQVPPTERILIANSSGASAKLVGSREPPPLEMNLGGKDQRPKVIRV